MGRMRVQEEREGGTEGIAGGKITAHLQSMRISANRSESAKERKNKERN